MLNLANTNVPIHTDAFHRLLPTVVSAHDRADERSGTVARLSEASADGGLVELTGVVKRFGAVLALDQVDLQVRRGEIFGIIGRSGAGKSTLIRAINGLEPVDGGRISLAGRDITGLGEAELIRLRRRIGMIFQHFNLLSAKTVYENVALPLRLAGQTFAQRDAVVRRLLDLVGLNDKATVYPAKLSGGQKQRVGIARALAGNPDLLLSDEATSALDPETTRSILALLKDLNRRLGITIVLITHEMAVIREICDRVAVMEAGRVVELGTVWQVFGRPQSAITKSLLESVRPPLPGNLLERVKLEPSPGDLTLLAISVDGEQSEPLALLQEAFGAGFRLVHGGVDAIQGRPVGRLIVAVPNGPMAADFVAAHAPLVEVVGYVAG